MSFRTRFAPSPTGPLHLGHAYSAMLAHDMAMAEGGEFLLRIDDLDQSRARPEWVAQISEDLKWLGLWWPEPVRTQSAHLGEYQLWLENLWQTHVLYQCTCTRADIRAAVDAPQEGPPPIGPDGLIYPGTCRNAEINQGYYPETPNVNPLRLDMGVVASALRFEGKDGNLGFTETGSGPNGETGWIAIDLDEVRTSIGDVVVSRRGLGASYHLSVVVDDGAQQITDIVRGQDLFEATKIHVILQRLLGLPTPRYHHHRLIRDETGKRLAKRDDARAIAKFRNDGATPDDIRRMVGISPQTA